VKLTIAAVAVAAAAALSFAAAGAVAGSALAQPSVPLSQAKSTPPQLTGARLQAGLLPASAFGANFTAQSTLNSGGTLKSTRVTLDVPTATCSVFEGKIYAWGFGNTAGALAQYVNPNAARQRPEAIIDGFQDVIQFATAGAATTFFTQARAKYAACLSFSEPNPADTNPGGGTFQISTLSVSKTTVSGDQAFAVTQQFALSETPGVSDYIDVLYVVAGTDVYSMWQDSGTNDEPSPALMGQLIRKVQALYPR
jgi:hypothetical protein